MNRKHTTFSIFVLFMVALLALVTFVEAIPTGPTTDITITKSERLDTWGSKTTLAEAGNVSEFDTDSSSITRTWQGYFGNISGMIVLGDALNNTLYDWSLASPQGEIYAVSHVDSPDWYNVRCSSTAELEAEDIRINANQSVDEDTVNGTFVIGGSAEAQANYGGPITHPTFYVANVTISNDTCPVAAMYNSSRLPSDNFKEVLLSDQATVPIIYTGIIAHTVNPYAESDGFDGRTHDFEMIVGEDGHFNDLAPQTYWFYLELE